jgi:hypothetical protein
MSVLSHMILSLRLGGRRQTVYFSGNCRFLVTKVRHARFLQPAEFIDQAADSGSGHMMSPRDFRQAHPRQAVSDNRRAVDVERCTTGHEQHELDITYVRVYLSVSPP